MLRPKPTTISLSMKDVVEHLESIDKKAAASRSSGNVNPGSMRQPLGALKNHDTNPESRGQEPCVIYLNDRDARIQGITPVPTDMLHQFSLTIRSRTSNDSDVTPRAFSADHTPQDDTENRPTAPASDDDSVSLGFLESDREDAGEDYTEEQDSEMTEDGISASPPRPSMDYSNFEGSSRDSSSFVPEDASTPPDVAAQNAQVSRLRGRNPLPRSPLFRSINPGQTPMRPTTIGLAPRLQSPGTPGTPTTLFSQPPRSARTYRHRDMTYSYEESENPNAEETRIHEDHTATVAWGSETEDETANETEESEDIDTPSGTEEATEDDEEEEEEDNHTDTPRNNLNDRSMWYRERSSHNSTSSATDDMELPSSPPVFSKSGGEDNNSRTPQSQRPDFEGNRQILSSPSLQLPPPFSAVPRRVSDNAALPAASSMSSDDERGRSNRSSPQTPRRAVPYGTYLRHGDGPHASSTEAHPSYSPASATSQQSQPDQQNESPGSGGTARSIGSLPQRILSTYRSRSPHGSWRSLVTGAEQSSSTTERLARSNTSPSLARASPRADTSFNPPSTQGTPTRESRPPRQARALTFDGASASHPTPALTRAQTMNTPSRLMATPATPRTGRSVRVYDDTVSPSLQPQTPANLPESRHRSVYHPSYTAPPAHRNETPRYNISGRIGGSARRVRGSRSDSPEGQRHGGFVGLYGGRENGDEEGQWMRGRERDRVGRRLFVQAEQEEDRVPERQGGV